MCVWEGNKEASLPSGENKDLVFSGFISSIDLSCPLHQEVVESRRREHPKREHLASVLEINGTCFTRRTKSSKAKLQKDAKTKRTGDRIRQGLPVFGLV